jgi:hypothetical protein
MRWENVVSNGDILGTIIPTQWSIRRPIATSTNRDTTTIEDVIPTSITTSESYTSTCFTPMYKASFNSDSAQIRVDNCSSQTISAYKSDFDSLLCNQLHHQRPSQDLAIQKQTLLRWELSYGKF